MGIGPGFRPNLDKDREKIDIFSDDTINKILNKKGKEVNEEFTPPKEEITDEDLHRFDTETTMPVEEFLKLADYSIAKLNNIINRADAFLRNVKPEAVTIPYDEHTAELSKNLGVGTVNKDNIAFTSGEVDCLLRTAATDMYANDLKDFEPSDVNPTKASAILRGFAKKTKDFFPVFGIKLLLLLFWLFFKLTVNKLLRMMCKYFGRIKWVGKYIRRAIDKVSKALIHQPSCHKGVDLVYELNKPSVRRFIYNPRWDVNDLAEGIPEDPRHFCETNNPSIAEIEGSRELLKQIFKHEVNDPNKIKSVNMEISAIQRIRADAVRYSVIAGDIYESVSKRPNSFYAPGQTAATIQGGLIGFFSTINGLMIGLDKGISAIAHLEFLTPRAKDWVCCFVRIFYVLMPLLFRDKKDADARKALHKIYEFYNGGSNKEPFIKVGKKERLYIEALDKVLGYLLGSSAINIDLEFPFDKDLIMGAIYSSLAEVLALAMNMMYGQVEYNINSTMNIPEVNVLLDFCPPLDYFLSLIRCSINTFYVKIMESLSLVWLKGNEMLKSFEASFEAMVVSRNVKLFKNILKLLLNFGAHLKDFCDLDKITDKYKVDQLLNEIEAQLYNDSSKLKDGELYNNKGEKINSKDAKNILTPSFSDPSIKLGPDNDAYVNSSFFKSGIAGPYPLGFNLDDSPIYTGNIKPYDVSTSAVSDESIEDGGIAPCGNAFNDFIRTTINNINLNK